MTEATQKEGFDWNELKKKGKRDAQIKKELEGLYNELYEKLLEGEDPISEDEFNNEFLPNLKEKIDSVFENHNLPSKEATRRKEIFIANFQDLCLYMMFIMRVSEH